MNNKINVFYVNKINILIINHKNAKIVIQIVKIVFINQIIVLPAKQIIF